MTRNNKKRETAFLRWAIILIVSGTVIAFLVTTAFAQNYPTKPVNLIVQSSVGGGNDIFARVVANYIQPYFGQPIVVQNKPGAMGQIAWGTVAKAQPDGYTIGIISCPTILLVKMLNENVPFEMSDFKYIANMQTDPTMIAVHQDSPFKTMKDLIEYAKKNPGKLNVGSDGPRGNNHLSEVILEEQLGIKMHFVSYNGSGPAITALMGKQTDLSNLGMASAVPHLEAKRLRALAYIDKERFPLMPEIPTIKEATGVDVSTAGSVVRGLMAPKGVSAQNIKVLEEAIVKLLKDPKFLDKAKELGMMMRYTNSEQSSGEIAKMEKEITSYIHLLK